MSCGTDLIECDTVQIIEPRQDQLVDTAGTTSDMDERGELVLTPGQTHAEIVFQVPKLNPYYHFEYLYIDSMGNPVPGAIQIIPTVRVIEGFQVLLAGTPLVTDPGVVYTLYWRVVIVRTASLVAIDSPEVLYLQMPRTATMTIPFVNPRSGTNYGFTELRVENLIEAPGVQTPIDVQVIAKTNSGFTIAVSPTPPSDFYFLKVRTP